VRATAKGPGHSNELVLESICLRLQVKTGRRKGPSDLKSRGRSARETIFNRPVIRGRRRLFGSPAEPHVRELTVLVPTDARHPD
jgi:hypothetical protein